MARPRKDPDARREPSRRRASDHSLPLRQTLRADQWRSEIINYDQDLFESLDNPFALPEKLHIY
jgi:hypothetical protein